VGSCHAVPQPIVANADRTRCGGELEQRPAPGRGGARCVGRLASSPSGAGSRRGCGTQPTAASVPAQLVSQGMTNKEVAAQCWVSPRTVRQCSRLRWALSQGDPPCTPACHLVDPPRDGRTVPRCDDARASTHVRELQPPASTRRTRRDDLHDRVHVLPRLRRHGPVERVPELCWRLRTAARPARAPLGRGRAPVPAALDDGDPQAGRPRDPRGSGRLGRRAVSLPALTPCAVPGALRGRLRRA
jgi:hypothetical protein